MTFILAKNVFFRQITAVLLTLSLLLNGCFGPCHPTRKSTIVPPDINAALPANPIAEMFKQRPVQPTVKPDATNSNEKEIQGNVMLFRPLRDVVFHAKKGEKFSRNISLKNHIASNYDTEVYFEILNVGGSSIDASLKKNQQENYVELTISSNGVEKDSQVQISLKASDDRLIGLLPTTASITVRVILETAILNTSAKSGQNMPNVVLESLGKIGRDIKVNGNTLFERAIDLTDEFNFTLPDVKYTCAVENEKDGLSFVTAAIDGAKLNLKADASQINESRTAKVLVTAHSQGDGFANSTASFSIMVSIVPVDEEVFLYDLLVENLNNNKEHLSKLLGSKASSFDPAMFIENVKSSQRDYDNFVSQLISLKSTAKNSKSSCEKVVEELELAKKDKDTKKKAVIAGAINLIRDYDNAQRSYLREADLISSELKRYQDSLNTASDWIAELQQNKANGKKEPKAQALRKIKQEFDEGGRIGKIMLSLKDLVPEQEAGDKSPFNIFLDKLETEKGGLTQQFDCMKGYLDKYLFTNSAFGHMLWGESVVENVQNYLKIAERFNKKSNKLTSFLEKFTLSAAFATLGFLCFGPWGLLLGILPLLVGGGGKGGGGKGGGDSEEPDPEDPPIDPSIDPESTPPPGPEEKKPDPLPDTSPVNPDALPEKLEGEWRYTWLKENGTNVPFFQVWHVENLDKSWGFPLDTKPSSTEGQYTLSTVETDTIRYDIDNLKIIQQLQKTFENLSIKEISVEQDKKELQYPSTLIITSSVPLESFKFCNWRDERLQPITKVEVFWSNEADRNPQVLMPGDGPPSKVPGRRPPQGKAISLPPLKENETYADISSYLKQGDGKYLFTFSQSDSKAELLELFIIDKESQKLLYSIPTPNNGDVKDVYNRLTSKKFESADISTEPKGTIKITFKQKDGPSSIIIWSVDDKGTEKFVNVMAE